jgi:hypothetical protein
MDDDFVTHQRPTAPVLGNVAEHAMFDLVLFASSRREMTDTNHDPNVRDTGVFCCRRCLRHRPCQQFFGIAVAFRTHLAQAPASLRGLLFRALAPMRNHEHMVAVAAGIEAMPEDEAAYWLGMAMHRK